MVRANGRAGIGEYALRFILFSAIAALVLWVYGLIPGKTAAGQPLSISGDNAAIRSDTPDRRHPESELMPVPKAAMASVEGSAKAILDGQGAITGVRAIQRDIGDGKIAKAALRESDELYRTLVEISPDAILLTSLDGTIGLANRQALALSGYAFPEELVGRNARSLIVEEDQPAARRFFSGLLGTHSIAEMECRFLRKDGSRFFGELNAAVYADAAGNPKGFVEFIRDLTSRKQLESQLLQSQKMEAIGKLAGGVSHDFNNMLTAILGYSDLMLGDSAITHSMRQDLEAIKKVCDRASALVRQLLSFSRRQMLQPRELNLNSTISDLSKMLRRLIGEDIELVTILDPELAQAKADPVQIEQVLLSLSVVARDAMPGGGKLTIQTANVDLGSGSLRPHSRVASGPHIMIAITDTGRGMDEETLSHIFEPSFSSDETDQGIGMGLSAVYGIIDQSGGTISIQSEPGHGTSYRIYLPRVHDAQDERRQESGSGSRQGGSETILIAEDEDSVRGVVRSFLEARGYRVIEARDGEEAARVFEANKGPIRLLVTDLIMPRMGGLELAQRLIALDPTLKVLYMSGYSDQLLMRTEITQPGTMFLQKPFSTDSLAKNVRQLLDTQDSHRA